MASICYSESRARSQGVTGRRRKGGGQGIKTELTVQITAQTRGQFIKANDGAEYPGGIYGVAKRLQLFGKRSVAQGRLFYFGREFQKIREQAVEHAKLFLEGRFAIFRKRRGIGEKLGETLTAGSTLENTESGFAGLSDGGDIHFEGAARAAFGELRGEFDFRGLAAGLFLKNFFHSGELQRRKVKLHTARNNGG